MALKHTPARSGPAALRPAGTTPPETPTSRTWDEPFFSKTYPPIGRTDSDGIWAEKVRAYEATR